MKTYSKLTLLVVMVLFLSLTACTLKASTPPPSATKALESPFPTNAVSLATLAAQTAIARTPGSTTPGVVISTETPTGGEAGSGQQTGGGQQPTATPQTSGQTQGGGQTQGQSNQPSQPIATPPVTLPATYALQKGEWPICIARRYNLDLSQLFAMNGMNMSSKPGVGTVLKLPVGSTWNATYGNRSLTAHPATYTVVSGDTVYTIACKYGSVTPDAIITVNGLSGPTAITPGQKLNIP
jgi:LysM repeat protein